MLRKLLLTMMSLALIIPASKCNRQTEALQKPTTAARFENVAKADTTEDETVEQLALCPLTEELRIGQLST